MTTFDDAARQAGAEIIDVIDNDKPGCFHEIITKHHADLRATYEVLVELAIVTKAHIREGGNYGIFVVEELLNDPLIQSAIERSKG